MRTSRFSCRRVSLLGRPGENRTLRASAPCRSHAFRHRITELAAHLMRWRKAWLRHGADARIPPPHHGTGRTPDASSHFVQGQFRAKKFQRTPAPVGQQVGRTLGSHRDLQSCGDPIIALFYVRAISLLPFPTRTYTTAQSPAACILHPRTANAYTVGPSPAPGSVRCLQLLGRTWLAPIPESRDHPLHRPFLDKLISENGPAENPQEIILNSLPCKCLFLWDLSRHRFQPDCLLRPLNLVSVSLEKPHSFLK